MHEANMSHASPLVLDPEHRDALLPLARLLEQWNGAHNLVSRQMDLEQIQDLLWECTAFGPLLPLNAHVADLGSGAGLPALPLAVVRPDLRIEAVEPREKRCTWIRFAATKLKLAVQVKKARWKPTWGHYDRVVSRAVFPPEQFDESVGHLANQSLQMTGQDAHPLTRRAHAVLRAGACVGLILAGSQTERHDEGVTP